MHRYVASWREMNRPRDINPEDWRALLEKAKRGGLIIQSSRRRAFGRYFLCLCNRKLRWNKRGDHIEIPVAVRFGV